MTKNRINQRSSRNDSDKNGEFKKFQLVNTAKVQLNEMIKRNIKYLQQSDDINLKRCHVMHTH